MEGGRPVTKNRRDLKEGCVGKREEGAAAGGRAVSSLGFRNEPEVSEQPG